MLRGPRQRCSVLDGVLRFGAVLAVASTVVAESGPSLRMAGTPVSAEDRAYWAFQPVKAPPVPTTSGSGRDGSRHPVDAFISAALEAKGLAMNPPATPREQVRRGSFDLLGLPPTPEEVADFEKDPSDAAWMRLVDRWLASPHYGERWGRHWLDVVRYAESNGYERDGEKPDAWRYRDYVIGAFNRDKPYDRFIREQLAGDEVADGTLAGAAGGQEWRDAVIATGFYRLHVWDDEPDSTVKAEYDDLDDIMVTTGAAFLGLTIGCARCHDHKFDPISQADYYSMLGFIRGIDPYGQQHTGGGGRGTGKIRRALVAPADQARWEDAKRMRVKAAEARLAAANDAGEKKRLEAELRRERDAAPPFDHALSVAENGPEPRPVRILARGDPANPKAEVSPAFPAVLGLPAPVFPERPVGARTSGRRSVLADRVASPANPLTARVMVNRVWQKHLGVGLVPTPDDFGRTGGRPSHPELLDHLAAGFVADGWSVKRLHKTIMTSRAYRMSSRAADRRALAVDEADTLLWRQRLRRVEAEVVRDTMLAVSGELDRKLGGPSVYPTLPREVHATQDSAGKGWTDSPAAEQDRRSVYLVVKRALKVPLLECLDLADSTAPAGVRPVTTTAPQALMLLNDPFVQARAAALGARIVREAGGDEDAQVARAFRLVLQRAPTEAELRASRRMLADQRRRAAEEGVAQPDIIARESFCRGLLNLNETVYVD